MKKRNFLRSLFAAPVLAPAVLAAVTAEIEAEPEPETKGGDMLFPAGNGGGCGNGGEIIITCGTGDAPTSGMVLTARDGKLGWE